MVKQRLREWIANVIVVIIILFCIFIRKTGIKIVDILLWGILRSFLSIYFKIATIIFMLYWRVKIFPKSGFVFLESILIYTLLCPVLGFFVDMSFFGMYFLTFWGLYIGILIGLISGFINHKRVSSLKQKNGQNNG